ncbi:sulfotransferase 1B1-like [Argopecten irradians]|uniref:sulfotransferase 1B1-like n=1 Tax=Argopecten irradians TaxID=31199 RepID=UPI003719D034
MLITGDFTYAGTTTHLAYSDMDVINNLPSPRLLATHLPVDMFPKDIKNGVGMVVNIVRNPKDVAVSYYCYLSVMKNVGFTGSFDGFLRFYLKEEFFFGNWFGAIKQWLDIKRIYPMMKSHTLFYEDLKRNTLPTLERLVQFLEVPRDEKFCKTVMANMRFSTMKMRHETESKPIGLYKDIVKDGILPIYRKGEIGDWKRWFTPAQSELFDRVYKDRLAGYDIDIVFE